MSKQPATATLAGDLRAKRSAQMIVELEASALKLFRARGFAEVTVDEIAQQARISVRTFYRYFPMKADVFQVQIDRRASAVRDALAARPLDEHPLHSIRLALVEAVASEDAQARTRCWTEVVAVTPDLIKPVLGGILLKTQVAIAEFVARRLGTATDALVPTVIAAATVGVLQASQTQWYVHGGDLVTRISQGMEVLEQGIGDPSTWPPTTPNDDGAGLEP